MFATIMTELAAQAQDTERDGDDRCDPSEGALDGLKPSCHIPRDCRTAS